MDINPWTRGHALVIPRDALARTSTRSTDADLAATRGGGEAAGAPMQDTLGCDGVNLLNACEPAAWQTVFHFHMHVIPRYEDDPLRLPGAPAAPADMDELAEVAS